VDEGVSVVVVGSGTPVADPERGGPATLVILGERRLLFDAGPGVLRGIASAGHDAARVQHIFLTHLHSDHTLGLDEMISGAWTAGREGPLEVHGPPGTRALVASLVAAFAEDRAIRTGGLEAADPSSSEVIVTELEPGVAFDDGALEVRAFAVAHGTWEHAFGYRIAGAGRVVVISGDTSPSDAVVDACAGCDVLVHEVYSAAGWREGPEDFRAYHGAFHTSGEQLGRLAARARPRLLVLDHLLFFGRPPAELLDEVRASFDGDVLIAQDGESY